MLPHLLLIGAALAEEKAPADRPQVALHGDVKLFVLTGFPKPWLGFSDDAVALIEAGGSSEEEMLNSMGLGSDPYAQGVASTRLKGEATWGPLRLDVHWAFAAQNSPASGSLVGVGTGVGSGAPELLPLSGTPDVGAAMAIRHRVDRLVLSARLPHLNLSLGRQPVSFGNGQVFTPLDLVNPFHPATIHTEYKPGVDALRADIFAGTSAKITLVTAWAGAPVAGKDKEDPSKPLTDDLVIAACGQYTVGITDLSVFVGGLRSDFVVGVGTATSVGPVGLHAEATLTRPPEDPLFVRAVGGAMWRPGSTTTLTGELYFQSLGATKPEGYLEILGGERAARGELWSAGQLYAAVAGVQEITPILHANLAVIGNLRDPSALLSAGLGWSVADNAELALGGYAGLGKAPDRVEMDLALGGDGVELVPPTEAELANSVNSEFGLYPAMVFVQGRMYF